MWCLLSGKLLKGPQLGETTTTVPIEKAPAVSYGLGIMRMKLSCGAEVWGHSGAIQGSIAQTLTTADGKHALTFDFNGDWDLHERPLADAEFCASTERAVESALRPRGLDAPRRAFPRPVPPR
ncbi:hypothetical protein [Streptomyces sp. NPDC052811]|uniref:hypothetical protein n=1 Tax=Streptomyces sp. NPDC052811 TaxID=3155731 RepID=UPI00341C3222